MKCISLFSGVAGLELGLRKCIWLVYYLQSLIYSKFLDV